MNSKIILQLTSQSFLLTMCFPLCHR